MQATLLTTLLLPLALVSRDLVRAERRIDADRRRGRILAFRGERYLHQQRHVDARMGDRPQRRHAATVHALADGEAIYLGAGLHRQRRHVGHLPIDKRSASQSGRPFALMRAAAVATS